MVLVVSLLLSGLSSESLLYFVHMVIHIQNVYIREMNKGHNTSLTGPQDPQRVVMVGLAEGGGGGRLKMRRVEKRETTIYGLLLFHIHVKYKGILLYTLILQNTLMCLSTGTPKNNKFSSCSKWKIYYF